MKNVLSFGRRTSCEEKQSLFSKSRESSLESEVNTMREDGDTDTEIFSAEDIGLDRLDRYIIHSPPFISISSGQWMLWLCQRHMLSRTLDLVIFLY